MLVTKQKYEAALRQALDMAGKVIFWQQQYKQLQQRWNDLVTRINEHGGEEIFERNAAKNSQFTPEEIDKLVRLCHPDKHNNSQAATELTAKLLKLRKG